MDFISTMCIYKLYYFVHLFICTKFYGLFFFCFCMLNFFFFFVVVLQPFNIFIARELKTTTTTKKCIKLPMPNCPQSAITCNSSTAAAAAIATRITSEKGRMGRHTIKTAKTKSRFVCFQSFKRKTSEN